MARAALDWSLDDLAKASGVARRTIARFEAGETVLPDKQDALRKALEDAGVSFVDSGKLMGAVRLREQG
jgi:transcriptional regulator with XRE-family HTH domain